MKLNSNYDLISAEPNPGGRAALWIADALAQEAANAINAGAGVTTPDAQGTPQPGTILPGSCVALNANGYWDLATSPDLSAPALPIPMGFVHGGDEDFDGAMLGKLVVLCGYAEFLTDQFNGASFPPGTPLVANAGKFEAKTNPASGLQVVGFVGNRGLSNGVLHVLFFGLRG
jgi:hypothetical protein